ncbi:esterase/lipase family protein [Sphingomonas abietis]|uniref:Alpha/beta hydrolase n=1 Tax=Sphingomonas abietis TaxID=3012344 RepID=A0ABY7NPT6_9SPHN|nr:alpha/beta hydrolase [Sphingomonas abietis]WBO23554.1 alpha/beta hydrolase [Sphingomonas abietis]
MWAVASLLPARRMLASAPRGDGRPVMLLPGLVNSDRSLFLMRRYLRRLGYDAVGWGLGRNLGARAIGGEGERLLARVARLHEESGQTVTLVGVSLGGIMARFVAHRLPEAVREVITISSPYAGDPRATRVWRMFERLTGERIDAEGVVARRVEIARPLPVPATAIWSRSDGLVNGLICRDPEEDGCRAIEVRSGHLGVQIRPAVLRTVADILAVPGQGPLGTFRP